MAVAHVIPGYLLLQCPCGYRIDLPNQDESYVVCPECGKVWDYHNGSYVSTD